RVPVRLPVVDDSDAEAAGMHFLAHQERPSLWSTATVMWLLRLRMRFTRPMARNCHRLRVGPSSTRTSLTYRSSAERALLCSALATAESRTAATTRAEL